MALLYTSGQLVSFVAEKRGVLVLRVTRQVSKCPVIGRQS